MTGQVQGDLTEDSNFLTIQRTLSLTTFAEKVKVEVSVRRVECKRNLTFEEWLLHAQEKLVTENTVTFL